MHTILFIFSEIVQLINSFFKKGNQILGMLGLAVFAYIAGTPSPEHTYDYEVYSIFYYATHTGGTFNFERGYSEFALFCLNHGLSYEHFRLLFASLAMVVLYMGISRFTKNLSLFVFIYGITVFFYDAVQIRNLMMISLVILGMSFLINLNSKNVIIAIAIIILSAQFHTIGYIFLLIVIVRLLPEKIVTRSIYIVIFITIILMILVQVAGVSTITGLVSKSLGLFMGTRANLESKVLGQYNYGSPFLKLLLVSVSAIMTFFLENLYIRHMNSNQFSNKQQVLLSGSIVSIICLPTLFLALDYSRIQRNAFLFVIIGSALFFEEKKEIRNNRKIEFSLIDVFLTVTCLICIVTQIYVWGVNFQQTIPYLIKLIK